MKVTHFISSLDGRDGGTSWACAGMASAQSEFAELDTEIVFTYRFGENDDVKKFLQGAPRPVRLLPIGPANYPLRYSPTLRREVEKAVQMSDVIHVHGLWEEIQFQAVSAAIRHKKPVVLAPHGMLDPWSLRQGWLKKQVYLLLRWRRLFDKVRAFHFITSSEQVLAASVLPTQVQRIVEPLGVEFPSNVLESKQSKAARRFLFLSRIHRKKNLEFLLEALREVDENWILTIAGMGEAAYVKSLEQLVRDFHLEDRVGFIGSVDRFSKWNTLGAADVFVLPSLQENFGIVVVEALGCGVPVILSTEVGLANDLRNEAGVEVLALNKDLWVKKLKEVCREGLPLPQQELIRTRFAWISIAKAWRDHYRSWLNASV